MRTKRAAPSANRPRRQTTANVRTCVSNPHSACDSCPVVSLFSHFALACCPRRAVCKCKACAFCKAAAATAPAASSAVPPAKLARKAGGKKLGKAGGKKLGKKAKKAERKRKLAAREA